MSPGLTRISPPENRPKIALKQCQYIGVVCHVYYIYIYIYTLLKVVGYYDLSVLSMSVMGFQKKLMVGGWGELYPNFFLDCFKLCKAP